MYVHVQPDNRSSVVSWTGPATQERLGDVVPLLIQPSKQLWSVVNCYQVHRHEHEHMIPSIRLPHSVACKRVWQNHSLRLATKLQVYRAVIVTTFLYGSESRGLYRKQIQLLEQFHQRCLRCIMGIHWQDYVTNNEVLEQASLPSIETMLMLRQLRWAGHVSHMGDTSIPKAVLYGELRQGRGDRGAPRRRYKDQLKRQITLANIHHKGWEPPAADRQLESNFQESCPRL